MPDMQAHQAGIGVTMTHRHGIAPVRKHGPHVTRHAIVSQPAHAPPHPFTGLCSALPGARCPACGDVQSGSLRERIEQGKVGE